MPPLPHAAQRQALPLASEAQLRTSEAELMASEAQLRTSEAELLTSEAELLTSEAPLSEPLFSEATGAPLNAPARAVCVREWTAGEAGSVRDLPFHELHAATAGFHKGRRLGGGGSCIVYEGDLYGLAVAVKHLSSVPSPGATDPDGVQWGAQQFTVEMQLLCRVSHPCICSLFAFSTDGPQRCLVLELCTGGALDKRLQCEGADGSEAPPLQWDHRLQIALDIARALKHLHGMDPPMLHRDLKTANVLLDGATGGAKVADFGLVREGAGEGQSHVTTKHSSGTKGYMPIEYCQFGKLSEKVDSYALGIVLLELLTGLPHVEIVPPLYEELDFFKRCAPALADAKAGAWPPKVVKGLVAVAKRCSAPCARAQERAAVGEVLPRVQQLVDYAAKAKAAPKGAAASWW